MSDFDRRLYLYLLAFCGVGTMIGAVLQAFGL